MTFDPFEPVRRRFAAGSRRQEQRLVDAVLQSRDLPFRSETPEEQALTQRLKGTGIYGQ